MNQSNLTKKITDFVKYHNAFILVMVFVVGFGSAIFASPEVRENVVGQKIVEEKGKDNSFLLAADLENYDLKMEITDILEDDKYYYVHYRHKAIVSENGVWQETIKQDVLRAEKESNRYDDLGLYVAEKLSQVANRWLRVLKTAQEEEQRQGLTQKTEITRYSGLIGRFVDTKERKIPGYQSVLPEEKETPQKPERIVVEDVADFPETDFDIEDRDDRDDSSKELVEPELTEKERLIKLIEQILFEKYGIAPKEDLKDPDGPQEPQEPEEICDSENLDLCTTQGLCEEAGLYWHNNACHLEAKEEEEEVCVPAWDCDDWQPEIADDLCGQIVGQTRVCLDLNECGTDQEKPAEIQEIETPDCPEEAGDEEDVGGEE